MPDAQFYPVMHASFLMDRISGCTDYYAENEEEAFEMCRESVLSLNMPEAPQSLSFQEPLYSASDLSLISGNSVLSKEDMYAVSNINSFYTKMHSSRFASLQSPCL